MYRYIPGYVLIVNYEPFSATLMINGEAQVEVNGGGLFHFEYHRSREGAPALASSSQEDAADKHEKKIVGYWEDGLAIYEDGSREEKTVATSSESDNQNSADGDGFWEESFGGHRDSKPHGPASVGIDVSFPGSNHLYGLPEHASSMTLQTTKGANSHYNEPYRM